jgi:hypothetical protein
MCIVVSLGLLGSYGLKARRDAVISTLMSKVLPEVVVDLMIVVFKAVHKTGTGLEDSIRKSGIERGVFQMA